MKATFLLEEIGTNKSSHYLQKVLRKVNTLLWLLSNEANLTWHFRRSLRVYKHEVRVGWWTNVVTLVSLEPTTCWWHANHNRWGNKNAHCVPQVLLFVSAEGTKNFILMIIYSLRYLTVKVPQNIFESQVKNNYRYMLSLFCKAIKLLPRTARMLSSVVFRCNSYVPLYLSRDTW